MTSRTLLTVADALDFAAEQLGSMAHDQEMLVLIKGALKGRADYFAEAPKEVREAMIEPERQHRALKEAAKLIREIATEHRLHDAKELERLRAEHSVKEKTRS